MSKLSRLIILFIFMFLFAVPSITLGANGANFVLYTHHTEKPGELKIMFMNDIGQEADTTRYVAQMVEVELGITDRWTTGFMIEGQATSGEGGYNMTGFRWENRYRLFEYGRLLNPVIYVEYEDLGEDTKYAMEISGRTDAAAHVKSRQRERVLETRLILGHDFSDRFNVAFNWLNESDLDTGVTAFGYAVGLNYRLFERRAATGALNGTRPGVTFGVELYGALGDSDKGVTADAKVTEHYIAPNMMLRLTGRTTVKFGGAVGLTNVSQDIVRMAVGYEF